jgi:hypothetical protein
MKQTCDTTGQLAGPRGEYPHGPLQTRNKSGRSDRHGMRLLFGQNIILSMA